MAVTARFKVSKVTPAGPGTAEVELTPDYAQGRNEEWKSATPQGVIRLTIGNPSALEQFTAEPLYKPVHVLFEFPEE